MLHEALVVCPPKCAREAPRGEGLRVHLQLPEEALQRERDPLGDAVRFRRHVVPVRPYIFGHRRLHFYETLARGTIVYQEDDAPNLPWTKDGKPKGNHCSRSATVYGRTGGHELAKLPRVIQGLQQRVQVARRARVLEPDHAWRGHELSDSNN